MTTTEYHITAIRNGDVFGHETTRCDATGCAIGTEWFLGRADTMRGADFGPVHRGDVVELEAAPIAHTTAQMKMTPGQIVEQAIDESIGMDRVVRLEHTPELERELYAVADDFAIASEMEFWGEIGAEGDRPGHWRIHLQRDHAPA